MGYVYALFGALLFGANGSLTKLLMEGGLTATQITQFRTLGTAVIAALILVATDRAAFRITPRQLGVMAILGVTVAVLQSSYAAAINLLLEYVAVLLVAVIAFFFFKERVKGRLWIAIGLVLLGLVAVARPWEARLDPLGVALALVAAVSLAAYFLIGERQVARTSPLAVAFWTTLIAGLVWAPFSGWWELDAATFTTPVDLGGQWGSWMLPLGTALAVTIVAGSFLPFLLSFTALKHLTATAAGVVASSEVVFAFAVAWVWLGESLDAFGLVGAAIVLAGIVLAQTARSSKVVVDAELVLPADELPAEPGVGGRT